MSTTAAARSLLRVAATSTRGSAATGRQVVLRASTAVQVPPAPSVVSCYNNINTTNARRSFSDDSHSDFAPQKKAAAPSDTDAALKLIDQHVKANPVMLYMKGTPSQPMCGFSAKVVGILAEQAVDYGSVNVLDYPTIREAIKQYSAWPTIPQLYVQGEFIGGCDIVTDMHASGELEQVLQPVKTKQGDSGGDDGGGGDK